MGPRFLHSSDDPGRVIREEGWISARFGKGACISTNVFFIYTHHTDFLSTLYLHVIKYVYYITVYVISSSSRHVFFLRQWVASKPVQTQGKIG